MNSSSIRFKSRKYNKENLTEHAKDCVSFAQLIRSFGKVPTGGTYTHFQKLCRHFEVDTSHFTGQTWSKGHTTETHPALAEMSRKTSLTYEEIFSVNSRASSGRLRKAMLANGFAYTCEKCPNDGTWMGQPLTLHVDHINGVHGDNRRENLRFLCPNCHQQTATWGYSDHRRKKK